jgi:uncharacterized protein (TIGR00290 family)
LAREPVLLAWSGGKDSARALWEIQQAAQHEVVGLLTTVTRDYDRIAIHGVRRELLWAQADALGLPVEEVEISPRSSNAEYETAMREALLEHAGKGVRTVAFGDIFLEDLRAYRERQLAALGMRGLFPLWKQDTADLARSVSRLGFRAVLACVDTHALDARFAGCAFDDDFLQRLPPAVDPCGENGEFHTFVHDGPNFRRPVPVRKGAVVIREERFAFCDLLPTEQATEGLSQPR